MFMLIKGFAGCIAFVDGMTIPLSHHPDGGDFYYDQHGGYSAANHWITFTFTGFSHSICLIFQDFLGVLPGTNFLILFFPLQRSLP
jgi:hypothetical protein